MKSTQAYGFESTTDDVLTGVDLTGKLILVTGASAGLGVETTRALAAAGARVIMAVRDVAKAQNAAETIRAAVPSADLSFCEVDLASLASVRAATDRLNGEVDRLDGLIANAGIMACAFGRTPDGFEMQFGTNHLGHFVFVNRLVPLLVKGAPARVVLLSSAGHRFSDVSLDDPNFESDEYDKWVSYGRSKTANILMAVELDRRLEGQGVRAFAVHPGGIMTELGRHLTPEDIAALMARVESAGSGDDSDGSGSSPGPGGARFEWKTVPQGAATSVYALTSPDLDGQGGLYLEDCHIADQSDDPVASGECAPTPSTRRGRRRCGRCPSSSWARTSPPRAHAVRSRNAALQQV